MAKDKFSAVWVSHSSMGDFLKCPRAYYLNNVYKDPKTGHKITLMQPPLALGQAVHEVLEGLSVLPVDQRFVTPLIERFEESWEKVSGKKGGFVDERTERRYKERGYEMINRVNKNRGVLSKKAVKIQADLPYYWISEEENIILCGKIDWLEYVEDDDAVRIVDFKTGKREEDPDSLQLPIYLLLVTNCQKRKVAGAAYWYLDSSDTLADKELPELADAETRVLSVARKVKLARQFNKFECPEGNGCFACRGLEAIVAGEGELVGVNDYNQDVYILSAKEDNQEMESTIL